MNNSKMEVYQYNEESGLRKVAYDQGDYVLFAYESFNVGDGEWEAVSHTKVYKDALRAAVKFLNGKASDAKFKSSDVKFYG